MKNQRNKKFLRFVLFIVALALIGCGSDDSDFVATGSGFGVDGNLPPGVIVNPGTGRIANQAAANQRIFEQYLLLPQTVSAQTVANGPLLNLYTVPGGALGAGTAVSDFDSQIDAFTLDQPYYLYWVDPNPLANLGHECSILYLRESDGLLVEQTVDFDPFVADDRSLELESEKAANLIYTHPDWRDLGAAPGLAPVVTQVLAQTTTPPGVGQPGGPAIGGLGVAGASEARRAADLAEGANLFEAMGGKKSDFKTLDDDPGARKDKDDLIKAIKDASAGLGPDDKFLFVLSSHGSTTGKFCMGTDTVTWAELCKILNMNVTAGNINIVIDTCFAGLAIAEFDKWKSESNKRVRVITSTDGTPSYSRSTGLGFNLECVIKDLKEKLAAAKSDGVLTLAELEAAMAAASFTQAEIDAKICKFIGDDPPGAAISASLRAWKDDYLDKPGAGTKITRTTPGKSTGFDSRPIETILFEFMQAWQGAISSDDPFLVEPYYVPNFRYDGRDFDEINGLSPTIDIEIVELSLQSVEPITVQTQSAFLIGLTLTKEVQQESPQAIFQVEQQELLFRLLPHPEPVPPGQLPFAIFSQQVSSQTHQGMITTLGSIPIPPAPSFVDLVITRGGLPLLPGDVVGPGDQLRAELGVTGLAQTPGLLFAGQFEPMFPLNPTLFETLNFNPPPLPPGEFFLFHVFAENRDVLIPGQVESFSGFSRTLEVMTPP